jgi:acyl carrier protein
MNDKSSSASAKPRSLLGSLFSLVSSPSVAPKPAGEKELTQWLVQRIARETGLTTDEIPIDTSFADFGLDSRTAVSMSGELEKLVGRELSPTLIWDFPTIREVAHHLCSPEPGNIVE